MTDIRDYKRVIYYFLKVQLFSWFVLSLVFLYASHSIDIFRLLIVGVLLAIGLSIVPIFLAFFKISEKNHLIRFIAILIVTLIILYVLKSGILGYIYYPQELQLQIESFPVNQLGESGIIVLIAMLFSVIYFIFEFEE